MSFGQAFGELAGQMYGAVRAERDFCDLICQLSALNIGHRKKDLPADLINFVDKADVG